LIAFVHQLNRATKVDLADDDQAAADATLEQGSTKSHKAAHTDLAARLRRVEAPKLTGELMLPRILVTDQLLGLRVQVLLRVPPMLSRNAGGTGLLRTFTPEPGPSLTSIRKSPGCSSAPPGLSVQTCPHSSGSSPMPPGSAAPA
jgi:hypothetical protein